MTSVDSNALEKVFATSAHGRAVTINTVKKLLVPSMPSPTSAVMACKLPDGGPCALAKRPHQHISIDSQIDTISDCGFAKRTQLAPLAPHPIIPTSTALPSIGARKRTKTYDSWCMTCLDASER